MQARADTGGAPCGRSISRSTSCLSRPAGIAGLPDGRKLRRAAHRCKVKAYPPGPSWAGFTFVAGALCGVAALFAQAQDPGWTLADVAAKRAMLDAHRIQNRCISATVGVQLPTTAKSHCHVCHPP